MSELRHVYAVDGRGLWVLGAAVSGAAAAALVGLGGLSPLAVIAGVLGFAIAAAVVLLVLAEPERGLWLMLLATPLDTAGRIITSPVTVTVFHLTLLLTLMAWMLRWVIDPDDGRPRWSAIDVGIAMLLAAALWSLPGSLAPAATVMSTVRLVFMWVFFLAFVTWVRSERSLRFLVVLVVVTASLSAVVSVVQSIAPDAGIGYVHTQVGIDGLTHRPAAFFDDPNYLGTLLSLAILAAVGLSIAARKAMHSFLWLMPAALCSWGMIVTLSRTAWLGVMAGIVALVLAAPKDRRKWLIGVLVVLAVAVTVAAPDATVSRVASFADIDRDTSIRTRVLMLDSTIDMIRDNWVFGTGLSAYEVAYPPYRHLGALVYILKPHQLPLALWAEMGLPGVFAQLLLVGGVVWMVRKRRHRGWNVYEAIGVAGLLSILVQSLFQYYLYFQYLWLFLALTAVATRLSVSTKEVSR